jgi:hypothetical protein
MWTVILLLIFTPITYWKIEYLNESAYPMENIPPAYNLWSKTDRLWYSFIYTSSVFFKLTLKLEKLKFFDRAWSFYIIVVYGIKNWIIDHNALQFIGHV